MSSLIDRIKIALTEEDKKSEVATILMVQRFVEKEEFLFAVGAVQFSAMLLVLDSSKRAKFNETMYVCYEEFIAKIYLWGCLSQDDHFVEKVYDFFSRSKRLELYPKENIPDDLKGFFRCFGTEILALNEHWDNDFSRLVRLEFKKSNR